jgi:hypothetical protein
MSTGWTSGDAREGAPPLARDRPSVDGTALTPAQLRAEVAALTDPHRQRVDEAREQLAGTVAELRARLDPRPRLRTLTRRLVAGATRPPVLAGAAAALLAVAVARRGRRTG